MITPQEARLIRRESEYAYRLMRRQWGIYYRRPKLFIGNRRFKNCFDGEHLTNKEKRQAFLMYRRCKNRIFISDAVFRQPQREQSYLPDFPGQARYNRIVLLCHEHAHAIMDRFLPPDSINDTYIQAVAQMAFEEGLADYMSVQACIHSGIHRLAAEARFTKDNHEASPFFIRTALKSLTLSKIVKNIYVIGYRLAAALKPTPRTLKRFLIHPPETIPQLLRPRIYLRRLKRISKTRRS